MTPEEKDLLFKDICARLPYGVIIKSISGDDYGPAIDICYPQGVVAYMGQKMDAYTEEFLPYLRPMSSMTEEEKVKYITLTHYNIDDNGKPYRELTVEAIDWLNAIHVDYRGLISMGLALEVTEENNPYI